MSPGDHETRDDGADAGSRIRLGCAPDSWGVWYPNDPRQLPWDRFLDEVVLAGYETLELGPHGYLPTDAVRLRDELDRRGLKVSGGGVEGSLHRKDLFDDDVADARGVASLLAQLGARFAIYLPRMFRDGAGSYLEAPELDRDEWRQLVDGASEMGRMLRDDFGVTMVFHPHADSHVATQAQVGRFLEDTDASTVSLCLDVGHIAYCGGDSLELIEAYPSRIGYVHLKQVDPRVLEERSPGDLCFAEMVRRGVMCEPPRGVPAMEPLITALGELDRELFAIVEQDMYPCAPDVPLPIATRTREYLGRCGLRSVPSEVDS